MVEEVEARAMEMNRKNTLLETENQLMKQQLQQAQLSLQLQTKAQSDQTNSQTNEMIVINEQLSAQLLTMNQMVEDKQTEIEAYKQAVEQSDQMLINLEQESSKAITEQQNINTELKTQVENLKELIKLREDKDEKLAEEQQKSNELE